MGDFINFTSIINPNFSNKKALYTGQVIYNHLKEKNNINYKIHYKNKKEQAIRILKNNNLKTKELLNSNKIGSYKPFFHII